MSVKMIDLTTRVNAELENVVNLGSASAEGDGTSKHFLVAPMNRYVVEDNTFAAYEDGVEDTTGTMDYDNGVFSFVTAPASGDALTWVFNYVFWTDDMVEDAVETALQHVFPYFYYRTTEELTPDGDTYEFDLDDNVEHVIRVDSRTDATSPWKGIKRRKYVSLLDGDQKSLMFFSPPASGYLRVHEIFRPGWELVDLESPLEDYYKLNIPDRAEHPIVAYACYYLLANKVAPRMRADIAATTTGQGRLSPRQMNDASNAYYMRYQMLLERTRMQPWAGI